MSTISKQWLQQKIADMEAIRDDIPFGLGEDGTNTLSALRIALASLEAEAVAFRSKLQPPTAIGSERWDYTDHRQPDAFELQNCFIERLYTVPPAPVSVPDAMEMDDDFDSAFEHGKAVGWNAYRAAMLQSFGNSEQLNSPVIPDGWVMVPVEPTEDMIVNGFESEPDESFSDEKEWKAYDAMSGCQQAAHRAKLCWAAMIEAAPKLE
ncbi:hypothetical protein [Raoultella planticola]|uniref:hypothetical protein n=1 Tax=Raoultella planticola TaxID=575 RepID=UPI0034DD1D3F